MAEPGTVGMEGLRYLHLGTDPVAKRLYAVVFDAFKIYEEAKTLLEQYVAHRDVRESRP